MATELVIAIYRPHGGQEVALAALVASHLPLLRRKGLVTDRPGVVMRSRADGTLLEVFEWVGSDAARRAHEDAEVAGLWKAMEAIGEFPVLGDLAEAAVRFPHFEPVD